MNTSNFNNLIQDKPAKWAHLEKIPSDKEEAEKLIEQNQVDVPAETRAEVQKYIKELKEKGMRERTIRRMVMKKFNIKVV